AAAADETAGETEDEAEGSERLGIVSDDPNAEGGEGGRLDIDADDAGELDFGAVEDEVELPFEPLEPTGDIEMVENEKDNEESEAEAAPKKRRLRGMQAAPLR
ncbi:MAG: hypothetical protein NXI12_15490, partial [Alphaproteobacteria bacterium]|nr:hypothetical protein [Alphaproteobacteria bacterium]